MLKKLAEVLERNRQEATTQRAPEAPKKHSLPQARRTSIPHRHKTTLQASNISLGLEDGSGSGEAASRGVLVSIDKVLLINLTVPTVLYSTEATSEIQHHASSRIWDGEGLSKISKELAEEAAQAKQTR